MPLKNMMEFTQGNVDRLIDESILGTHYFVCEEWKLSQLRAALYEKVKGTGINIHTSYNRKERCLRVVLSR